MQFLANTGFLFPGLPFPDRIRAAARAGFDGVEFHDEVQRHDAAAIADLLAETGLAVGGLNTRMGPTAGCAAIPGAERDFAADLSAAQAAATTVRARAIHVLAGRGATDRQTYVANLRRALGLTDRLILIEPLSRAALADYHLHRLDEALAIVEQLGSPQVAVMFDWYHVVAESDPAAAALALERHRDRIGHVQAAAFPSRDAPGAAIVARTAALGFASIGLEYRPTRPEAAVLAGLRAAATVRG